jgi:hypothetical protein
VICYHERLLELRTGQQLAAQSFDSGLFPCHQYKRGNIMFTASPDARPLVSFTADHLPNLSGKYIPPTVEFASIVPLRQRITRLAPWGRHRIANRIANTLIGQEFLDW